MTAKSRTSKYEEEDGCANCQLAIGCLSTQSPFATGKPTFKTLATML